MKWVFPFIFLLFTNIQADLGQYFIAIKKNEGNVRESLDIYTPFLPPHNKFYADPMLFKWEEKNYLFFEDYDYKKGVISCVNLEEGLHPQVVLDLPIHLSFPHLFQEGKEIYMTPETYDCKSVSLFKAKNFPFAWEFVRNLVTGMRFSDPIVFFYEEYYWLFTSIFVDQLLIYYAKDLTSEFIPHPCNSKRLKGRNAGAVFYEKGKLIRPVMNCKEGYGKSVILKEILKLTAKEFIEKEVEHIKPTWAPNLNGTHSYSQNEDYVVYDGRVKNLPLLP